MMDYTASRIVSDLHPLEVEIGFSPLTQTIGFFLVLGAGFFIMQLAKEYYWLQSAGGLDSMIYDLEE